MSTERYDPRVVEPHWQSVWASVASSRRRPTTRARNTTSWRCSPTPRGASTWATCATTRWATCWPASCARAATTSCIRWAGTPSACRPRTPRMQNKVHPKAWTYREHRGDARAAEDRWACRSTGRREFATCDVEYYAQQQRLFLDFLDAGLVARKTAKVNWDPVDQTVLANEQVIDGKGWRSGAPVESRELTQWFFTHHRIQRGPARRAEDARPLAGKSPADAGELDRPLRRPARPLRVRLARRAERRERWRFSRPAPTRCSARNSWRVAPDHPLATSRAAKDPALAEFIEEMPPPRHRRRRRSRRRRSAASTPA